MYRACYEDGSELHVWHERERMVDEIRSLAGPADAAGFDRFCAWLDELYAVEMPAFIDRNIDSVTDLMRPLAPALRLVRLGGFGKLNRKVGSFFTDERIRRIFTFQSMYAGLAPYEALALYAVITYMDCVRGVFAPKGGMHECAAGLARAVGEAGATFRYDADVSRILLAAGTHGAVRGIELVDGERIIADAVVCNADLPVAYRTLLPGIDAPRVARRGRYSPSCLLWVAGVRGLPSPRTRHHNIHFGGEWDSAFKALIHDGERMPDPSILVTMHSADDASLAPEGCSTMYALEPMPNLDGRIDWTSRGAELADDLRARVARLGYPVDVEVEAVIDPQDWERAGMERGTPFALAHTFRQTGPFRPSNVDKRAPGLVFTGSSTLPGVGVPMVLISGKLAAQRVQQFAGRPR
jgi:phytoene desaturase